jgi:DNA mismatch repair protein MutL
VSSYKERFLQVVLSQKDEKFVHELAAQGPGFSAVMVIGGPEVYRNDRRQQYVFANGRRIQDFSLLQALEYGVQGWFPNGVHPAGAVFVDIDPALADFNIHPAKREARFADPGAIHHAVTSALRDFCRRSEEARNRTAGAESASFAFAWEKDPGGTGSLAMEALTPTPPHLPGRTAWAAEASPAYAAGPSPEPPPPGAGRYLGRLFGLFILVERENRLYIIDQHAAHERILYDRLLSGPIPKQELLAPIPFAAESAEDDFFLKNAKQDLEKLGVIIAEDEGIWRIEALPADWRLGDSETVEAILGLRTAGENLAERWAATLSCHEAIKDGDWLDPDSALALAEEAFSLPVRRCPHGRPIWYELSREDLFKVVKRL